MAAFVGTDLARFRVELREQAHGLDLFELALVPALLFCAPTWLLVSRLLASAISIGLVRRAPPIKLMFNVAQYCLRVGVAVLIGHAAGIGSHSPVSARVWLAVLAACAGSELVSRLAVITVIWMAAGRPQASELLELAIAGPILMVTTTTLGLVCALVLWANPWAVWMLAIIGGIAAAVHHVHHKLRQRYANLRILSRFTRDVSDAGTGRAVVVTVLEQARAILNAEWAELMVKDGAGISRTLLTPLGVNEVSEALDARSAWLLGLDVAVRVDVGDKPSAMTRASRRIRIRRQSASVLTAPPAEVHLDDALVSPLRGHEGLPDAVIVVGHRLGDGVRFDDEDLELASTLAGAAGLALRNGRLVDALRSQAEANEFQARHDPLTQLANRSMFLAETEKSLSNLSPDHLLAVMLVDLDNFKDVNDTLGHHFGDRLLCRVAERLVEAVGSEGIVSRLGGDEFAIMIPAMRHVDRVEAIQAGIHACLGRPFLLEELSVQVRASVGVALAPQHAQDASGLLKSADVAMYMAKAHRSGTQIYEAEADQHSRRRLALAVELSDALATGQFELHYQPQADFRSGNIVAVEALVRWNHPRYGLISPDEFIGLAEQSGAIAELTRWVMRRALADMAAWRQVGHEMQVSINVSPRNLLDAHLTDDLARLYEEYEVDPVNVTLEITESGVVADPEQASLILGRLALGGTRISIDDFGTGHSSLARLTHLPVSEIKIDRSFVDRMTTDSRDRAIVEATIQLSKTLGLSVVAEGIEDPFTWKVLSELGCDLAQGYYLAKPLRLPDLMEFLAKRGEETAMARRPVAMPSSGSEPGG
ncbi:MAG TPA: bifunctional diguanylate cyclase/phosphodiesterase [Acidimicrobiales bacterium]|nr:bifunctional diguanylate cyclase/phosphodiesterase [Acidimicrobiales bacterium]